MTNAEFNELFRKRTMNFAVRTLRFLDTIPFNTCTKIMTFQLGKAGTSVGANFRAFCRGRSKNERFSKICIVVEEADECVYWLELFIETVYGNVDELKWLHNEAEEILRITSKIKSSHLS